MSEGPRRSAFSPRLRESLGIAANGTDTVYTISVAFHLSTVRCVCGLGETAKARRPRPLTRAVESPRPSSATVDSRNLLELVSTVSVP